MEFSYSVTSNIDEHFCYVEYNDFHLIMMKENGFINATKLCNLENKDFNSWLLLDETKDLIRRMESVNNIWNTNLCQSNLGVILEIGGENDYEISGSYVHPSLIPYIASWLSSSLATKIYNIMDCLGLEYKDNYEQLEELRNDFNLCDLDDYGLRKLSNDLQNLDLVSK